MLWLHKYFFVSSYAWEQWFKATKATKVGVINWADFRCGERLTGDLRNEVKVSLLSPAEPPFFQTPSQCSCVLCLAITQSLPLFFITWPRASFWPLFHSCSEDTYQLLHCKVWTRLWEGNQHFLWLIPIAGRWRRKKRERRSGNMGNYEILLVSQLWISTCNSSLEGEELVFPRACVKTWYQAGFTTKGKRGRGWEVL